MEVGELVNSGRPINLIANSNWVSCEFTLYMYKCMLVVGLFGNRQTHKFNENKTNTNEGEQKKTNNFGDIFDVK